MLKKEKKKVKRCRFCGAVLDLSFVDLGMQPFSNNFIKEQNLDRGQTTYPLHAYVCRECFLVQLEKYENPSNIFNDYAYFSSYSESWLHHSQRYVKEICNRLLLNEKHLVIEIACNDGYLLQYFQMRGIPCLGIEPAKNIAKSAQEKGLEIRRSFFGCQLAEELVKEGKQADLLIANNVVAHVPDINDFVEGVQRLLNVDGIVTVEFPHLLNLIEEYQYDTIYHEHFSYLSLHTICRIFFKHNLRVFNVERWPTHGGSLRVFACHANCNLYKQESIVEKLLKQELYAGIDKEDLYIGFADQVSKQKRMFLSLLIDLKEKGKQIVAYGAAAKGNTLLNYCGIQRDMIDYVVDKNPYKQGRYLPGSLIPIVAPEKLIETKPDYILILPWNIKNEILEQLDYTKNWNAKFIVAIPKVEVL